MKNKIAKWIVACDQPFEEVDRPEFRDMLEYAHHRGHLDIPHRDAMRSRIMKLGEDTVDSIKEMFAVSPSYFLVVLHAN